MSRNEYLIKRARKAADRRKRIFGIDPPPGAALLLEREPSSLKIRESIRLLVYVLFKSPRHRLELFWRHLTAPRSPPTFLNGGTTAMTWPGFLPFWLRPFSERHRIWSRGPRRKKISSRSLSSAGQENYRSSPGEPHHPHLEGPFPPGTESLWTFRR
jgi:hypothetical protein